MASHMTHFYMAEKVLESSAGKARTFMDDSFTPSSNSKAMRA